jgi:peptide chain release factor 2
MRSGGFFDIPKKEFRVKELEELSQADNFWNDNTKAQEVLRERSNCQRNIDQQKKLDNLLSDAQAIFELADETKDPEFIAESEANFITLSEELKRQEFLFKMRGEFDSQNAIIEINAGSGGTEAQDWAQMLLRMYLRWGERKGFKLEELDYLVGEGAGIKHATILVQGEYAYGYLRSEAGVHRLVRISPFDSNARRHTSFASVGVTPDIEQEIEIVVDDKDLRVDTYRSSGAGGQHVNKTDSAVRLTHIPTGIVVACQNERSQHKNKDRAMKILKAKLYELEQSQQAEKIDQIKGVRKKIDFGSQIRSYVMEPYQLVKDLRTDHQTSQVDAVLDGELDPFMESYLMSDQ